MPTDQSRHVATAFIDALTTGRHDEAFGLFADGAAWRLLGRSDEFAFARSYSVAEIRDLVALLGRTITHGHHVSIDNIIADGHRAAIEMHSGGLTEDDRTYDNHIAYHLDIHDGRITELREYLDTGHLRSVLIDDVRGG